MTFHLEACRFHLAARRAVRFPPGTTGNIVRGALGRALHEVACVEDYRRIFEPASAGTGPSGLSDWPRPFVLRASELEGRTFQPGQQFCVGVNLFDTRSQVLDYFTRAFALWADPVSVEHAPVTVELNPGSVPVSRIRVEFQTPTELKANCQEANGDFSVLLARARDRVSTLRSLYGAGPLEIDFRGLAERARAVKTLGGELRRVDAQRRSSRNGQRHGIGGLVGFAVYEGDLVEFLPFLEAAHWTGVGRHCAWGNGQIATGIL